LGLKLAEKKANLETPIDTANEMHDDYRLMCYLYYVEISGTMFQLDVFCPLHCDNMDSEVFGILSPICKHVFYNSMDDTLALSIHERIDTCIHFCIHQHMFE